MSKNHGPDSSYLAKVAQFEREKQQRRDMRRKAAKKKAKDKENIRKQRKADRLVPTQLKETPGIKRTRSITDPYVPLSSQFQAIEDARLDSRRKQIVESVIKPFVQAAIPDAQDIEITFE